MRRFPIARSPVPSPSLCSSTRQESASMVEDFLRQSPLSHLALAASGRSQRAEEDGVALAERPYRTVITLPGQAEDAVFVEAIQRALGLGLPRQVGQVSGDPLVRANLWFGPDAWWVT